MTLAIQFHAMPEEHAGLMAAALADCDLWVSTFAGDLPNFKLMGRADKPEIPAGCLAVVFTASEPDLDPPSIYQFASRNPDALVLEIGELTEAGLAESFLWTKSRDPDLVRRWRAAVRPLKSALLSGAIAFNSRTGLTGPMKWHRYTRAAREAYAAGIVLRPVAGRCVIQIPPPDPE
ncbi:hypothetical protein [Porphyrobacter sp. YT40]|uniref:hypothetical protein n=1 Tax=Porphyrobacter sp. YT40 TaxID=2547601 RepID=UPI00114120C5|nr:hypothetical protein [Porphyrobacter sp. YT40]QDH35948.1 hypothetical protein E2E27_17445 [Porphyrobacter sp. YT40]